MSRYNITAFDQQTITDIFTCSHFCFFREQQIISLDKIDQIWYMQEIKLFMLP